MNVLVLFQRIFLNVQLVVRLEQLLVVVGDDQEAVAGLQLRLSARDEVMAVALDHGRQRVLGEAEVDELVAVLEDLRREDDFAQGGLDILRQVQVEDAFLHVLIHQSQFPRHKGYGRPLNQEREDGDEEYDVEEDPGVFDARYHRVGGKDDGDGAAQTDPRDIQFPLERKTFIRQKTKEYAQRARKDNHEYADEHADARHGQQFVRIDQEAEDDEHHDLPQPDEAVEERGYAFLVDDGGVADLHTGDVSRQVAVAVAKRNGGEGEEGECHNQYRIERLVAEVDAVGHPDHEAAEEVSADGADDELRNEVEEGRPDAHAPGLDVGDEDEGEEVGHRVVTTTLQFEQRAEAFLQLDTAVSEEREDGGRVG